MAGEEEERSRYSRFISERHEYQARPVGRSRQRSMGAGLGWTDRRPDRSRSQVSKPTGHRGDRGRKDCATESWRESRTSQRTTRHMDFHGESARRMDWRNDRWDRDSRARRGIIGGSRRPSNREMNRREGTVKSRSPEARRDSRGRSQYVQRDPLNQERQHSAAHGRVSSVSWRGHQSAHAPLPSPKMICRPQRAKESGSVSGARTYSPSPPPRRTVTLTPGTERTLESAGDIEASSSGCQESAGETRTVCMKGSVAEKKPRRTPKVGKKDCPICGQTVTILKRHVEAKHLPWYFSPELACWQCRFAEETTMKLWGRHGACVNGQFDNEQLRTWSATMWGWISLAARFLEVGDASALVAKVGREKWYPKEKGFQLSPTRRELLWTAQKLQTSVDIEVSTQSPNCVAALLTWQTAVQLLIHLPEDARGWFRDYPLREPEDGSMAIPRMRAVDSHCHLETVQQRFYLSSPTSVLQLKNVGEHPAVSLRIVIWNRVFPGSWRDIEQPMEEEDCRVVQTFGAHPRLACTQVPWEMLQAKIAEPSCHGIGECGLDATATEMDAQKRLFQLYLLEARKTGKVLILHLREDPKSPQEVFREALRMTSQVLEKTHPVYLHSFDAGWDTYVAWSSVFPNLLIGMSWLTTKGDEFEMLGRVMPFDHIALETDSPHLCPLAKRNNVPQLIHHQAQVLASLRNLPLAVVFSGTMRNVERLFRL